MSRLRSTGLRARKKHECRARIEAAALQLFKRRGLDATRIEEITARAKIAKGTFFNYYASKHDVLAERLRRLARDFLKFAEPKTNSAPRLRLRRFFVSVEELFRGEGVALLALYREVFARPDLGAMDADVEEKIVAFYREVLEDGRRRGLLRSDFDVDVAARVILDLWSATLRLWVLGGTTFGLAHELDQKLAVLFRGLERN